MAQSFNLKALGSLSWNAANTKITGLAAGSLSVSAGTSIYFATATNDRMMIDAVGNVGIRTNEPEEIFHVATSTVGEIARFGAAAIGNSSSSVNYAFFGHADTNKSTQYALSQGSLGDTFLNAAGSTQIAFRINNVQKARLNASGYFGVGINPVVELQISGPTAYKSSGSTWGNPSDQRLKNNILDYSKPDALGKINGLRLRKYKWNADYLEFHKLEDREYIGFIAQEVETTLPCCIKTHKKRKETDLKGEEKLEDLKVLDIDEINKLAIGAIQELSDKLDKALARIAVLESS